MYTKVISSKSLIWSIKYTFLLALFLAVSKTVYAAEFAVDRQITYTINDDLIVSVKEELLIENLSTEKLAQNYTLTVSDVEIWNVFAHDRSGNQLSYKISKNKHTTNVTFLLSASAVGKGAVNQFTILYDLVEAVNDKGQIREINIPKLSANPMQRETTVELLVKNSLGKPAFISPNPESNKKLDQWQTFRIPVTELKKFGLRAIFGNFQLYDFNLRYYISNPTSTNSTHTIALPPETAYQKIAITSISTPPDDVNVDEDGNWLAFYRLSSNTDKSIQVTGSAMVFSEPWGQTDGQSSTFLNQADKWLQSQKYWEVGDSQIEVISRSLETPQEVYNYVINTLQYDHSRLTDEASRKGALKAITQPTQAICMEFTDLFITLARASNIPARQAIGFAYSDNPTQRPLSLVADVLHAWPEYWDTNTQTWTPTDPTWAVTTGGVNYFNNWDVNHLTLVINGINSNGPLPAGFYKQSNDPQRDVNVVLGNSFPEQEPELGVDLSLSYPWWPFEWWDARLVVKNSGFTAFRNLQIIYPDDNQLLITPQVENTLSTLPPYGKHEFLLSFKATGFLNFNNQIKVLINDREFKLNLPWTIGIWQVVIVLALGGGSLMMIILLLKLRGITKK